MKSFLVILFCTLFVLRPVGTYADIVNEFVQIQCNEDLNFLKIQTFNINGQIPLDYARYNPDEMWQKYHILSIDNLFEINADEGWQKELSFSTQCTLKAKNKETKAYQIKINGFMIHSNPNKRCGGHRSLTLWIQDETTKLVEALNFLPHCFDSYNRVSSVTLLPHESYGFLEGKTNVEQKNGKIYGEDLHFTFWFDPENLTHRNLPVTNEILFIADPK